MIIKNLEEIAGTSRVISAQTWRSERLLLAEDGLPFSLHITTKKAGTSTKMCYKNHLEVVYCVEGEGYITELVDNVKYLIQPGTVYALNNHDPHILEATTEMKFVCFFLPPCIGQETHDDEGSYPLLTSG
jgi:L-ectoine synthase